LFVCSDSDYCEQRRDAGHVGSQQAVTLHDVLATPADTVTPDEQVAA
jgi:alpha-D-ribose 1-methylphosphonate 5-phosphate C-P lyase